MDGAAALLLLGGAVMYLLPQRLCWTNDTRRRTEQTIRSTSPWPPMMPGDKNAVLLSPWSFRRVRVSMKVKSGST